MATTPSVSILLPSYNHDRYLALCISSIVHQTFSDFELLIVDDGSSDRSVEIAQSYARKDKRIKVWSRPNKGIPATLNELYGYARGKYIAQIGSDDQWLPRRLEIGMEAFRRDSGLVGSFSNFFVIDGDGAPRNNTAHFSLPLLEGDVLYDRLLVQNCLCACTALIKREALKDEPYSKDFILVQDWDLWLRLGSRGKLRLDREVGVLYRWHGDNLTDKLPKRSALEHRQVYEMTCLPLARSRSIACHVGVLERVSNYCWAVGDRVATSKYLQALAQYRPLTADEKVCQLLGFVSANSSEDVKSALHEIKASKTVWLPQHRRIIEQCSVYQN